MEVIQLLINGITMGCISGMIAISFSLIYSTTGTFHIAHAGILSLASYCLWFAMTRIGLPGVPAIVLSVALCAAAGAAIQGGLYRRLTRRGASPLVVMIASLGLLTVIDNLISTVFSADTLFYPDWWGKDVLKLGGVYVTYSQILEVVAGLVMLAALRFVLSGTVIGRRIRAVSANPLVAELTRLRPARVYLIVYAIGSALVAVPGMLIAADFGVRPYTGMTYLLVASIAMIAAGAGTLSGAFAMAVVLSLIQNLSLLFVSGLWGFAITFAIFVIVMVVRPRGVFSAS